VFGARVSGVVPSVVDLARAEGWPVEVLHDATVVRRRPARTVGPEHPEFARLAICEHPAAFRVLLPGGRIAGRDPLVLTRDRRALLESTFDREQLERNATMRARLASPQRLRGRHLALVGPWTSNHYHWFLDLVPRLALLPLDAELDASVLVPASASPLQRESLELAGIAAERIVPLPSGSSKHEPHVQVDELWFPSLTGRTTGNPQQWVIEWLREHLAPAAPTHPPARLYVSRADAAGRRVVNETAVEAELRRRGFETIMPGTLPLVEQLARFAKASVVVGAHGAGLVGLFAARDARVVEIFEPGYVNGCFYALSDAAGHRYWYLLGERAGSGDIGVDIDLLKRTLDDADVR
jgi:capsular polysaccharide biosynthesis protein